MSEAKRDGNRIATLLGVSNVDGITPVVLWADPVTHRLLVDIAGGGDVVGPASAVSGNVVLFDGTTGKLLKDGGTLGTAAFTASTAYATAAQGSTADAALPASSFTASAVTGKLITGFTSGAGTVAATDTILQAINKLDGNIAGKQNTLTNPVTGTGTINEIPYWASSSSLGTLPVATYPSLTELSYVKGLTSDVQTQLGGKLSLSGGTMTGDITLGENTSIALDPAGSADGRYSGITTTATAGETVAFGDLIYLKAADSKWWMTDADASATGGPVMVGMVVVGGNANTSIKILLLGIIRADAKFPALTVGGPVYLGETAGAIQTAIPTGADNVIRVVGFALTADEIYFNPSQDHQLSVA